MLVIAYERPCILKSESELVKVLEEGVLPEEQALRKVVQQVTGYQGNYFNVIRNRESLAISIGKHKDVPQNIPNMLYSLWRVKGEEDCEDFTELRLEWCLDWGIYQKEWNEFYMAFQRANQKILDVANPNVVGSWGITGSYSVYQKEEREGLRGLPNLER